MNVLSEFPEMISKERVPTVSTSVTSMSIISVPSASECRKSIHEGKSEFVLISELGIFPKPNFWGEGVNMWYCIVGNSAFRYGKIFPKFLQFCIRILSNRDVMEQIYPDLFIAEINIGCHLSITLLAFIPRHVFSKCKCYNFN